ncbi:MAG: hypothetical protein CMN18_06745 [Roseovarius sp.]|nr:hypothetical protein [Roseovarius sp.]|tara:strand:- start:2023 stop:2262 length:240 start_codon:yes stop_codon:yes gene_type:complete
MLQMHGFSTDCPLCKSINQLCAPCDRESDPGTQRYNGGKPMTRDELNRELRAHSASWQAVMIVYGAIIGTFVLSAMAIL